jgi:hypothetical protein
MLDSLTKRISWAIEIIKDDKDLDKGILDVDLAKILGTNKNTLAGYRQQKGLLKGEVIERLVSHYHFNPGWLLKGEGEPFPGARAKYPDVCGPEIPAANGHIKDAGASPPSYKAESSEPMTQGFSIAEDLMLAAKVLESKTHYAMSLHQNIRSFAGGVNDISILTQVKDLQDRFSEIEGKMEALQSENATLRTEVNRLKATYECPTGGSGRLANTSGE